MYDRHTSTGQETKKLTITISSLVSFLGSLGPVLVLSLLFPLLHEPLLTSLTVWLMKRKE
jgi:hypothetical protein